MNTKKDDSIRVITALGEIPKFFGISRDLLVPLSVITGIFFFVFNTLLSMSDIWWITLSVWFSAAWAVLCGNRSYEFTNRFIPLPGKAYFNLHSLFVSAADIGSFSRKMRFKIRPQTVKTITGKREKIVPFQIESHLHAIMRIQLEEDDFSVLLRCDKAGSWSASIPFVLEGIHPEMSEEEAVGQVEAIREALKDIPFGESLTLMLGCHSGHRKRLQQLRALIKKTSIPLVKIILASEEDKLKEITAKGFRQEWSQYAFCTWTQDKQELRRQSDLLGRTVNLLKKNLDRYSRKLTNTENSHRRKIYCQLASEIYENSFLSWKSNLSTKANLKFRPLTPTEIWSDLLWYRFNRDVDEKGNPLPVPPIPQLVTVSRVGNKLVDRVEVSNPTHPKDIISILIEGQQGQPRCPQHHQRRDLVKINGKYVAAMSLESAPERWRNEKTQLNWLWKILSSSHTKDTEIWVELSNGDKEQATLNLKRLSKQSNLSQIYAKQRPVGHDVDAAQTYADAITAQERLNQGAIPLFAAMTVLVYRDRPQLLEAACQRLDDASGTAKLVRERTICWKLLTETFPFNCQKQLKSTLSFSERRPTLETTSAVGLTPFSKPKNLYEDGVELIYREGGYPIYLDLFKYNERAIICGTSGSGKSILAFDFIRQALALNIPVIGLDLSDAGESTFELITKLLGQKGSYINILKNYINVLQPPDLRRFDSGTKAKRYQIWLDFTREVVTSLAMGQIEDLQLRETVDSCVIRLLNLFMNEPTIIERYDEAFKHGWKSPQWQNMPTLHDLLFFCSVEKLGLTEAGDSEKRAIALINNQIGAKLQDPIIGKALGSPSNVSPNPLLKFFALSGLSNENNQYIMSLVAHIACLNTSLENPLSLSVFDEAPSLFAKKGFADLVGQRFATGRKEGQSVVVIGQNLDPILDSSAGKKIFKNTNFQLTGKISVDAAKFIARELNFPPKIIYRNSSEAYEANKQYSYTHWLLSRNGRHWDCLYFPPVFTLAALANSPEEKAARDRILAGYSGDWIGLINGVSKFGYLLNKANTSNTSLSLIGQNVQNINHQAQSHQNVA